MRKIKVGDMMRLFETWYAKGVGITRVDTAYEGGFKDGLNYQQTEIDELTQKLEHFSTAAAWVGDRSDGCPITEVENRTIDEVIRAVKQRGYSDTVCATIRKLKR
jgi:hypothetical protein